MKSLAIQLAVVLAGFACYLMPSYLAERAFGAESGYGTLAGIAGVVTALSFILWRVVRSDRRDQQVAETFQHPQFGVISRFHDRWEATVTLGRHTDVKVTGFSSHPTPNQESSFAELPGRLDFLLSDSASIGQTLSGQTEVLIRPDDLLVERLSLFDKDTGDISLTFGLPHHSEVLPWGLHVDYERFIQVHASDGH